MELAVKEMEVDRSKERGRAQVGDCKTTGITVTTTTKSTWIYNIWIF